MMMLSAYFLATSDRILAFFRSLVRPDRHAAQSPQPHSASTATVCLRHRSGRTVKEAACGDGPIEAIFRAMGRASGTELNLTDIQLRGLTSGFGGEGEVIVEVEELGQRQRGRAIGNDTMRTAADAFLRVINRVLASRHEQKELVDVFGHG